MSPLYANIIPYCGRPPGPSELIYRWNIDPILIGVLLALLALYFAGVRRIGPAWPRARALAFGCGWGVGALALVSPLCPLSVSLFAARVGQHMVLTLVAAPLVAMGHPLAAFGEALRWPRHSDRDHSLFAATAFMALLWFWHTPGPYAATFLSDAVYWEMHVSMIGVAVWLWAEILNGRPSIARASAAAMSMAQMGFLGALITLAERPVYLPHRLTTAAWGLSPLEDQQLGGAIMWVPGAALFLAVGSLLAWRALAPQLGEFGHANLPRSAG